MNQLLNKTVIVIPTYNEINNIPILLERLSKLNLPITILFVDDNSPDGTGELIDKLKHHYNFIEIIHKPQKNGYGDANKAGFNWALTHGAGVVGTMDADLSHRPEDLPALLATIHQCDIVIGSRRIPGGKIINWSWWRHFESAGATFIARLILNIKAHDVTSGLRLYRVSSLNKIPWQQVGSSGYAWQEEVLYLAEKNNLLVKEIPITFADRKNGKSKLGINDILEFFITIMRLKFKNKV